MAKEDTAFLGLRIDPTLKEAIERLAAAEERSVSKWVNRVLAKEVKRLETEGA
jgi:predicted HicB family RNase H-like nuclease